MNRSQDCILARLTEALSSPLPQSDLAELLPRLAFLEEQVALLRSSPLIQAEEPSLPPSLEERP